MKSSRLNEALVYVDDRYLSMVDNAPKEGAHRRSPYRPGAYRRIIAAAAAVAVFLALGIAAYAADLFGIRALLRLEKLEISGVEYSKVSLTQPQEVPEELDPAIAEKVANSDAAWAEWSDYMGENAPVVPESFLCGEANSHSVDENADGTYTVTFYSLPADLNDPWPVVETRIVTAEEYAQFNAYMELTARMGIEGYDFNYHVYTQKDADKLEQIAAKYGLALRREDHLAWSSDTAGQTGEGSYTNKELAEMTAEIGCAGNIFYETPVGFDKVYWYDEGTFCISYYVDLPSCGERVTCYGYNSMYATLSSGEEVFNTEADLTAFTARTHTAPDGTDVTILFNGVDSAYIYVYLENSFFAEHVYGVDGMTDADLDAIADGLQYSLIGR